jgi:DNA polymerase-4
MARQVARRAKAVHMCGTSITIKIKYSDFKQITRSTTLSNATCNGKEIGDVAVKLAEKCDIGSRPVRLVGVGISSLRDASEKFPVQLEFSFMPAVKFLH